MALDDSPSVEVEVKDVGGGGDTPAAADTSAPSPSESSAETASTMPADYGMPALDTSSTQPAEDTGREADGNKDMNLEVIKANAEPKTNHGMVAAAQQVQESQVEQRDAKKDEEKEFEETLERARDSEKQATARAIKEKEELEHITTMRAALDDKNTREAFVRILMEREHITREEAEKRTSDLQRRLELEEMEKKGQKLSEKQREELERLKKETEKDKKRLETVAKDGIQVANTAERNERTISSQDVSVAKRAEDFSEGGAETTNKPSVFDGSVPSGIKTDVALTTTYNTNAAGNVVEIPKKPQVVAQQQMTVVAEASGGMGFG